MEFDWDSARKKKKKRFIDYSIFFPSSAKSPSRFIFVKHTHTHTQFVKGNRAVLLTRLGFGAVVIVDIAIVDVPFPLLELQPIVFAYWCDCEFGPLCVVVITVVCECWAFVRLVRRRVALVPSCWEIVGLCACVPAMLLACLIVLFFIKKDMCQSSFWPSVLVVCFLLVPSSLLKPHKRARHHSPL